MWEKGTGDLEEELMSTDSIDSYIHDNEGYFFERSITEALEATLEEPQRLLKLSAYAQLYPRSRRDAIIAYGILHHMELHAINDKLFAENERTLC